MDLTHEPWIVFDLEAIQQDTSLYALVSLLIIELILEKLRQLKGVRKSFIIDECWDMMRSHLKDFIEYMYRTVRKRNGRSID